MTSSRPHHYLFLYLFVVAFFLFILPFLALQLFPKLVEDLPKQQPNISIPDSVEVYITKKEKRETIPFENYICGVVASEMPASFSLEALKAQAVASRTYALGRIQSGTALCDTVHCQVYRDKNISSRVKQAVNATKGQVLTFEGKLASQALYFSSSAGDTENAEDVFANAYPYLVSVPSAYEPGATHKKEKRTLTIKKFSSTLKKAFPDYDFGTVKKGTIRILDHTKGGRVGNVQIGNVTLHSSDLRDTFSLYSTRFSFRFHQKKITIITRGSGHGVGMSQYGANGMAKKGKNYGQILSHYYRGTQVMNGRSE